MRSRLAAVLALTLLSALLLCSCLPAAAPGAAAEPSRSGQNFETYRLANGLTVIMAPIEGVEVTAVQVWVNAGSIYERPEEQGITHLIEHMIFKGTERRKVGEIASQIEAAGGSINAYTSFDHTVYHVTIKSDMARRAIDILADAIYNSTFDPVELKREKEVVVEEIRRSLDSPARRLSYAVFEHAYGDNPYGRKILGTEETVRSITREMILKYIGRWYVPANMCVVVAGRVETGRAKKWIEAHFGTEPRGPAPAFFIPKVKRDRKARGFQLNENVKEARVAMAYPVPNLSHPDIPALDVLATILGEGESSRLFSTLYHEQGQVYSVSAYNFTPKGPGLFYISANLSPDNLKGAFNSALRVIKEVQETGVSLGELDQAKLLLTTDFLKRRETAQGEADILGYFQLLWGDPAKREAYLAAISKLSPQDIKDAAVKYLVPKNLTLVAQLPEKSARGITADLARSAVAYAPRPTKPGGFTKKGPITKTTLSNGVTVLVQPEHRLPMVSFTLALEGGLLAEDERVQGISNILAVMLTQGTTKLSAQEFAKKVEEIAGGLAGFSGRNSFGLEGSFLTQYFESGMELAASALLSPRFSDRELVKVKRVVLSRIRTERERPAGFALKNLYRLLFGHHPYGLKILGSEDSVKRIDRARLKGFHRAMVRPERLILSVVGDVEPGEVAALASRLFGGMKEGRAPRVYRGPESVRPGTPIEKFITQKGHQTHIALGFLGVRVTDEDRYALKVLTHILAGQGGRLFRVLRDEMSLAYVLTSFSFEGVEKGAIIMYVACAPQKRETALSALQEQIELAKKSVTAEEVTRAKNFILGNYLKNIQEFSERAQTIALNDLYGLGPDYQATYIENIDKVTPDQVVAAARKYLVLKHSAAVCVGPKE